MTLKVKVAFLEAKIKELETTIETMIETMIVAQEQEREDRELLGDMYSYKNYREG
jgi:predicted ATP-grasp superfamily ATP-dependent carboligase